LRGWRNKKGLFATSADEKPKAVSGQYKQRLVSEENRDTTGHGAVEHYLLLARNATWSAGYRTAAQAADEPLWPDQFF
jgi:hypothetical protein